MVGTFYEKLESYLTCPICLELFSSTPLTLNCLHNYCSTCLVEYLRVLDFASPEFEDDLTPPVPVCPSCREPICSAKPNALLANILSDYFAEYPEKRGPDIHDINLSEAVATCNGLLEFYTRGMIIPTRGLDGLIVCMMKRVSQEEYERYRSENRGAGMVWISERNSNDDNLPRSSSPPRSAANVPLTPEQPINENTLVHTIANVQLPAIIASEPTSYHPNRLVADTPTEYFEGDVAGPPAPVTLLNTDDEQQARFFVMQAFDSWLGGDENWSLEEGWGNWQTDNDSMVNIDGQRAFGLS